MNIVVLDAATLGGDLDLSPLQEIGTVYAYPGTLVEEIPARMALRPEQQGHCGSGQGRRPVSVRPE